MRFKVPSYVLVLSFILCLTGHPDLAQAQNFDTLQSQSADPLKPGDRLRLTVVGFPDLSGEQMIAADGTIQVPLAGAIDIERLTPTQAVDQISEVLRPYIRRPQVALVLLSLSSLQITVTGEVVQPGPRLLSPYAPGADNDAPVTPVTLSAALRQAGGITPSADIRNVIIRRISPANTTTENSVEPARTDRTEDLVEPARTEMRVDLWQAIQNGDLAADPRVYDGDEIIVPTALPNSSDQQVLLASTIAPVQITVQVAGEVVVPGSVELNSGADVSAAVAAAGGPTDDADTDDVILLRMAPSGRLEEQIYEFGEPSLPLMNGDVIVVDERSSSQFLNGLGRVLSPLSILFDIFGN